MAGYNRTGNPFVGGAIIEANDFVTEFTNLDIAFGTSGHNHDGTDGNGPKITTVGLANNAVTGEKINSATTITAASFVGPLTGAVTGNVTGNLDAASATIDSLTITSGTAITSIDTDLSSVSASDNTLASAKAIKAYVDAQVDTADQLTELTDVTITTVADNEVLAYDTTSSKWINQTAVEAGLQPNDAGLTSIAGLTTSANQMIYTTGSDTYATTSLTAAGRAILDDASASAQRTTLGLAIGTNVQAYDAGLNSIAGLTTAADKMIYTTAADAYATTSLTAAGRALLDDNDASAQRTTLGLAIGTNVQAYNAGLADIAGLAKTDGNIIVGNGTNWVAESGSTARASLGLTIGTNVQAYDAGLASISGLTTSANKMIYTTASDTYSTTDLSAFGRSLIDDADAAAARTTLGLGTAATTAATAYATAAQGTTANSALQPADNISELTNDSGYITDYTVTESDVTAHQAALSITESQISDLGSYITGNQTITLSGDATGSGTTAISVSLAANTVGVNELNLSDGTAGQFLKTDGAGTISFADAPTQATSFTTLEVEKIGGFTGAEFFLQHANSNTIGNAKSWHNILYQAKDVAGDDVTYAKILGKNSSDGGEPSGSLSFFLTEGSSTLIEYLRLEAPTEQIIAFKDVTFNGTVDINSGSIDGTPIGAGTASTGEFTTLTSSSNATIGGNLTVNDLDVDNLQLDGNTISSTNANGNIILDPNGTGSIILEAVTKVTGYEPATRYDTDGDGSVSILDYHAYYAFAINAVARTSIEDGMALDAPWAGDSSATNNNCRFGLSILQGNLDDTASAVISGTRKGHGDAIAFGNIQHNGDGTAELINGISINGDAVEIGSSETGANTSVKGSLSKGSGSFKIDHPVSSKTSTHYLVHSFVESPQADNIYRGKVSLVNGSASVNIDTVAGMTEGTFVALNREVQCFTSNESDWDAVKGSVSGNILTISCENTSSTATISWLVVGERKDQHMYDTGWTDENGKVIVEPAKDS
jgi:hypothetical protein